MCLHVLEDSPRCMHLLSDLTAGYMFTVLQQLWINTPVCSLLSAGIDSLRSASEQSLLQHSGT